MSECAQIETIGDNAFRGASQLQVIKIGTETPPACDASAFAEIASYAELKVPSNSIEAYKNIWWWWWDSFEKISGLDE